MHGYTRKQLAKLIEVTEQSIWQYENGYTSPKMEIVNKLKQIFYVKSQYFYIKDMLSFVRENNVHLNYIAYRSTTINSIQKTQTEAKHVEFIHAFLNKIEGEINYPPNRLKVLREYSVKMLSNNHDNRITQIKQIANYARHFLDLDELGNKNLLYVLEKNGAFIIEKS